MKRRAFLSASALVAAATATTACSGGDGGSTGAPADGDSVSFKFAMVDNESSNYYKGAMKIAEEVEAATDGRVKIDVVAGGALGDERGTVEMAMANDLDIATAANPVLTNFIPEMAVLDQAFLWDDADQAHAAVDGKIGEMISEKALAQGLHVIGYMESGFRNVFSIPPIASVSDFSGVKIRTMQNQYHMAAFEAFGAMPVAMPSGEQFTALQQGTIDAVENAVANCLANGFYDITKDITYTNHAFVYIVILMSEDAWSRVPEDIRPQFLEGVKKGYEAQRQYLVDANNEAAEILESEHGVTFHEIDRDELVSLYEQAAESKNFTFDPDWMAAVEEAKGA